MNPFAWDWQLEPGQDAVLHTVPTSNMRGSGLSVSRGPVAQRSSAPKRARSTIPPAARKAVSRYVKTCMKREAEHKHIALQDNFVVAGTGTLGQSLVQLGSSTSVGTRIGSQVNFLSITARCLVWLPGAAAGDVLRAILVQDHQPNGAAATVANVLQTAACPADFNLELVGGRGMGPQRFTILCERMIDLPAPSGVVAAGTGIVYRHFAFHKKVDIPVHYSGVAGTVADVVKNNIFWLFISATGLANVDVRTQLCYVDV